MRRASQITLASVTGLLVASTVSAAGIQGENSRQRAQALVEQLRAERLLSAAVVELFSPFYSVAAADETLLLALNTVNEPVVFDLAALSPRGDVLPLGRYELAPSRHLALGLRDPIRLAGPDFLQGSLRVSFLGDTDTLQAWVVVRRSRQVIELSLQSPSEGSGSELTAFWDTTGVVGKPAVYLVNAGDRPVRYTLAGDARPEAELASAITISPGERHRLGPRSPRERGWLRIRHDGDTGMLVGAAVVEGRNHLSTAGLVHGSSEVAGEYEAARVPLDSLGGDAGAGALVTLFNGGTKPNPVRVTVVSSVTGEPLTEVTRRLAPAEVVSIPLSKRLASLLTDLAGQEVRVRISGENPGLLVAGRSVLTGGEIVDLSFFPIADAHAAGSYPVLPLEDFDVALTLANLDPEDSEVVAQFFWDGGTYAFGPVTIAGGTSYRLSVAEVVDLGKPDLLGRTLPRDLPGGFLKWKVQSGSRRLLGRTEARFRGGRDTFGFNCYGCCYEIPWGSIQPGFVEFEVGQSPLFQSCVSYDTCSGTMGPYPFTPSSMTVPAPFSWNGVHVSATSAAERDLSFFG